MCSSDDIDDWQRKASEREANEFAAELMMPLSHFKTDVDRLAPSLATFRDLAETRYATSLIATAIRFVKLTEEPVALALSSADTLLWVVPSHAFPYRIEEFVSSLSENSYAWDFFHEKTLSDGPNQVLLRAWISAPRAPEDAFIAEESLGMKRLGRVLSLITLPLHNDDHVSPEND
jgi:hypothetical protein